MRVEVGLHVPLLRFGRLRWAFWLYFWRRLSGFLGLRSFPISRARNSLDDFAPWRWLLIRDNQLTFGAFVKVVILGLALCDHGETKKKGQTRCRLQSHTSPRLSDPLVCSSMVFFNILSETGFIKKVAIPTFEAFSSPSADIHAVSATTGIREVFGFCLSIAVVMTPSTSGNCMSIKMRSGPSASANMIASYLFLAFMVSCPLFVINS